MCCSVICAYHNAKAVCRYTGEKMVDVKEYVKPEKLQEAEDALQKAKEVYDASDALVEECRQALREAKKTRRAASENLRQLAEKVDAFPKPIGFLWDNSTKGHNGRIIKIMTD